MRDQLFAFALVALAVLAAPALASDDAADVIAAIDAFNSNMNKGDVKAAAAVCASPAHIIDMFPPFEWQGMNACTDWANDLIAFNKKYEVTEGKVTAMRPKHVTVSGEDAYVVLPVSYSFIEKGKPKSQNNSIMTVALHKGADGWKITSWTWSEQ